MNRPFLYISPDKSKVMLSIDYDQKDIAKSFGGYKWNEVHKAWEYDIAWLPRITKTLNCVIGDGVEELLKKYEKLELDNLSKEGLARNYLTKPAHIPASYSSMYEHQYKAFKAASLFDSYCLFMEPGTGKTMVALELIKHWGGPALVVCPLSIIESVWMAEVERWAHRFNFVNLRNTAFDHLSNDISVCNYEFFRDKITESMLKSVNVLVIDESSKMKDHKSQITKTIMKASKIVPHKILMSGTPAPNNLMEYWSQAEVVRPSCLTGNFYKFRNTYFYGVGPGGYIYVPKKGSQEKIMTEVKKRACFFSKKDCLDLPEKVYMVKKFDMEKEQRRIYDEMLKQNITEFKGATVLGVNELAKIMKLREISSGFFIGDDKKVSHFYTPKDNLLEETLAEIGNNQAIIWVQFREEINSILDKLNSIGGRYSELHGGVSEAQKYISAKDFSNGISTYLVAHPASAGHGYNFQNCSYAIYYSASYSLEQYVQSQDRCHRLGQKNKVTYYHLVANETIDDIILKALLRKENLSVSLLQMLK